MSEWKDGDDSALYDEGYSAGVIDAVSLMSEHDGVKYSAQGIIKALSVKHPTKEGDNANTQ